MLVTEPNVVWQLVTVLPVAVVFVKSFRAHAVSERSMDGGWRNSPGSSSDGQVMWVGKLSSNSKN